MALWTRSGVRARPSRAGSSPRRTSISWMRSSKLAPVNVAGSAPGWVVVSLIICGSVLLSNLRPARVFERIQHGFANPYSFQMRQTETLLQYLKDLNAQVLRGWHSSCELRRHIQVL